MTKLIPVLILFSFLFTACQKSNSSGNQGAGGNPPPGGSGTTDLVKSITSVVPAPTGSGPADTVSLEFSYDGQNRCTEQISGKDTAWYTYTSNTLTSTQGMYVTTYYLNGAGAADSAHFVVTSPGFSVPGLPPFPPSVTTTLFRYFYNADGYLARMYMYEETAAGDSLEDASSYTVTNGNVTLVNDSVQNSSTTFSFTNQTTSTAPLPPDPLFGATAIVGTTVSSNLLGHPDVNLLATLPTSINGTDFTTTLSYVLDNRGRISTVTQKSPPGAPLLSAVSYYTYY